MPGWLEGEFYVIPVEPLAEAVRPDVYPDTEPLTYDDPPLAWALRHAADGPLREAARAAARFAARVAGLEDRPEVTLALHSGPSALSADLGLAGVTGR